MPELVIIAGPNGSGKSTLTEPTRLKRLGVSFPRNYINADEIARTLRQTHPELSQEEREHNAFREARRLRQHYREQKASYAFETVFSHPSTLLDIQQARAVGYHVTLLFVTTANPEINIWRVAGRVLQGGHDVPKDRIRSRYYRTMSLLPRIVEEVDMAYIFDSTDERQTRLCYQKGGYSIEKYLPLYLKDALLEPLNVRQAARELFPEAFSPDEVAGEYVGGIHVVTPYYFIQTVEKQKVRHDRLLLRGEFFEGEVVTIRYKDGQGAA